MKKVLLFLLLFLITTPVDAKAKPQPPVQTPLPPPAPIEDKIIRESYWKFHHSAYVGYRRDRQEFDSFGPGIANTRTQFNDRNTMQLIVASHAEFKRLVAYLTASYGWLVNGSEHFRDPGNLPPLSFSSFHLGSGYAVDVRSALAWRIELYKSSNVKFSFLPGAGYRYAHMMNSPQGIERYTIPETHDLAYCAIPKPNQQDWFGFYVEGKFETLAWEFFDWSLFCQYHWPYLVSKSKTDIQIYDYNLAGVLISDQVSHINSVIKSDDLNMVLAGTGFKFSFGQGWAVGTHFEGATTWGPAHNHEIVSQQEFISSSATTVDFPSKSDARVRWTLYAISVMVDRRF